MKLARLAFLLCIAAMALPAFASYGDDVAIVNHCGPPDGEHRAISPVTNQWQRDMYYPGDVVFHFQPVDGGWSLSSAWIKHIPVSRDGLASRYACVRDALAESAAAPKPNYDPTIQQQINSSDRPSYNFGIPYFWLIVALVLTLVLVLFVPSARMRMKPKPLPTPRSPQRRPSAVMEAYRSDPER